MNKAIFLSYSSQDADTARRICDALRAAGLEVWFDQSELRGGDAWDQSIRKQIKECALFVPVISASTDARPEGYFRLEWKLAVDRSHLMADDQPFFVPVILGNTPEPSTRVPEKFRERQWTRLADDASITAFAERVGKLIGGSASSGKNASNTPPNGDLANSVGWAKRSVPTDQTSDARGHAAPALSPLPPYEPERGDNSAAAPTPTRAQSINAILDRRRKKGSGMDHRGRIVCAAGRRDCHRRRRRPPAKDAIRGRGSPAGGRTQPRGQVHGGISAGARD